MKIERIEEGIVKVDYIDGWIKCRNCGLKMMVKIGGPTPQHKYSLELANSIKGVVMEVDECIGCGTITI
jgi:hypothetical protein